MQMEIDMLKTLSSTHKWMWLVVLLIGLAPPAGAQRQDAGLPATGKTLDLEQAVGIALDQNPLPDPAPLPQLLVITKDRPTRAVSSRTERRLEEEMCAGQTIAFRGLPRFGRGS
jgi:hypothetical protein